MGKRLTQIANEFVRIVGEGVDEVKKKKTSSLYSITDDDVVKACEMVGFGEVAQSVVLKSADDQGKKEKGLASFCVFHTKNYKVQTLAATSIVIILFTEPTFPDIKCRLSRCSQVFNEYKSRNVTLHEKGGSQRIISRVLEQDLTQVLTSN